MSEKVKTLEQEEARQKAKRTTQSLKRAHGIGTFITASGAFVRCIVSSAEMEELKKRHFRIKIICRITGVNGIQNPVKESDIGYVIETQRQALRVLMNMRANCRKTSRTDNGGGGGGETPPSRIFHRLVDEDKMADCILDIKEKLFHENKECEIFGKKCNIYDFFTLTHFYFKYIGIMDEEISQLAFCKYVNTKVFGGNNTVNVRNFNNYANMDAYKNFDKLLSHNKDLRFDNHPQSSKSETGNFLMAPFQEVGWKFQHSNYFRELKREQIRVQGFILQ